jgi:hypothetical protein
MTGSSIGPSWHDLANRPSRERARLGEPDQRAVTRSAKLATMPMVCS